MRILLLFLLSLSGRYEGPVTIELSPLPPPSDNLAVPDMYIPPMMSLPEEPQPQGSNLERWNYQRDGSTGIPGDNTITSFQGIFFTGWFPPDVQIAAGPGYVGEVVNSNIAFYDTLGNLLYSNTLYNFFSPLSPSNNFIFDPKIAYDPQGGRWLVLALQQNSGISESNYYLAVSQSSNPLGSWYYYALDATLDGSTPSNNWADYPGLGFNDWGIFITSNQFDWNGSFSYPKLRVLDKAAAYNGTLNSWQDFWNLAYSSSWKPAQCLTSSQTEYILRSYWNGSSYIYGWKVTGSAASPSLSTRYDIPVAPYNPPPNASQYGGSIALNSGDARMQDVTYKDGFIFGTLGEENPFYSGYCASRYFRLDTAFSVIEDISYGDSGYNYIYPRVAPANSFVAMVFTRCGHTEFAGVRYTTKALNATAFDPSTLIKAGEAYYVLLDGSGRNRWGDYSGAYLDPSGNSVWVCGEYASTNNQWGTWVARVAHQTGDTVPPPAPTLLSPFHMSHINQTPVTFRWSGVQDNSGIFRYELQYAVDPSFNGATTVNSADTTCSVVLSDTIYYWRVRAVDGAYNTGSWSSTWLFTLDTHPPGVPALIYPPNGSYLATADVTFQWGSVADPEPGAKLSPVRYVIEINGISTGNTICDTTDTCSYQVVLPEDIYTWRVRAFDVAGNEGTFSSSDTFGIDLTPPGLPLLISPDDGAILNDSNPLLIWHSSSDNLSGVHHYEVEVAQDPSFTGSSLFSSADTFLTVPSALTDGVWYWRVLAVDSAGNYGAPSDSRNFEVDTDIPDVPVLIYPSDGTVTGSLPDLIWGEVLRSAGEDGNKSQVFYTLQLSPDTFSGSIWTYTPLYDTVFSVPDSLFPPDSTFRMYWRVRAEDEAGNIGQFGNPRSFVYDVLPPVIESTAVFDDTLVAPESLAVTAIIRDFSGISAAFLHYRFGGGNWITDTMAQGNGDLYLGYIDFGFEDSAGLVEYYIEAFDNSDPANSSRDPASGYYSFVHLPVWETSSMGKIGISGPYPNPTSSEVEFRIVVPDKVAGSFSVYDAGGRLLWKSQEILERGYNRVILRIKFNPGVYFVVVDLQGKDIVRRKLLLMR